MRNEFNLDAGELAEMARRKIQFKDGFAEIGSKYIDGVKVTVMLELNWEYIEKRYYFSVSVLFDDLTFSKAVDIADSFLK